MFRHALVVPLVLGLAPHGAVAQEGPSFDCTKAGSSVEELICGDAALAALDRALDATYAETLEVIGGLDSGAEAAEDELKAMQRGWIGGRNECWKADDPRACVEEAYRRREAELVARFMLKEPVGTETWVCDGNPSNETVTYFYDTPLPSVRIERGDLVDVGTQVVSGSGAKYEASNGRWLWLHGGEMRYREADPDGTEMTCVPA